MSSILLCMMVVLAVAASGSSKLEPNGGPSQSEVERLQTKSDRQAEQLNDLRQLFRYCRASVQWDARTCGMPPPTQNVYTPRNATDDDDDDGTSTIVVNQPAPRPSSSKRPAPRLTTPKPDPTTPAPHPVGDTVGDVRRIVDETVKIVPELPIVGDN